jgi:hypothetical protein
VPERLGDIYVKYCKPINVTEFLAKKDILELSSQKVPGAALQLTRELYRIEALA